MALFRLLLLSLLVSSSSSYTPGGDPDCPDGWLPVPNPDSVGGQEDGRPPRTCARVHPERASWYVNKENLPYWRIDFAVSVGFEPRLFAWRRAALGWPRSTPGLKPSSSERCPRVGWQRKRRVRLERSTLFYLDMG